MIIKYRKSLTAARPTKKFGLFKLARKRAVAKAIKHQSKFKKFSWLPGKNIRKKNGLYRTSRASRSASSRDYFLKKRLYVLKIAQTVLIIIILIGIGLYGLIFSKFFRIKDIQFSKINNYDLISEAEFKNTIYSLMQEKKIFILPCNNLFLFNASRLTEMLQNDSRIEFFTFNKQWPDKLKITISESEPAALLIILGGDKNQYLNLNGRVFSLENSGPTTGAIPSFYDQSPTNMNNLNYIEWLQKLITFIKHDTLREIGLNTVKITEERGIFTADILTKENWHILVNSEADMDQQLSNLLLILKDKIKGDRQNLDHIELRFAPKIFYEMRGSS